jgi:hypothetical protein
MDDITTKPDPHDPHHHPAVGEEDINPNVAYEHGDADVFTVSKYTIALVFGILIAASAMYGLFNYFNGEANSSEPPLAKVVQEQRPKLPPQPRLQQFPKADMRNLIAAEEAQLNSYGWADQKNGIVRIPIEQAIDAVVQAGLPSRPLKPEFGLNQNGYRELPSVASSGRTMEIIR